MTKSFENPINKVTERGDIAKLHVNTEGLNIRNDVKNNEKQIISNFIKQYLPDRGDSKRSTTRKGNTKHDKTKSCDESSDAERSNNNVNNKENEYDMLIIPETGEKVCKNDIKLSYLNVQTRNDISNEKSEYKNAANVLSNKITKHIATRRKGGQQFYDINPKNILLSQKILKDNDEIPNQKDIPAKLKMNPKTPVIVTSNCIDQVIKNAGVSSDFRSRNAKIHNYRFGNMYTERKEANNDLKNNVINYNTNNKKINSHIDEFRKSSYRSKIDNLEEKLNDPLHGHKGKNGNTVVSQKDNLKIRSQERNMTKTKYTIKSSQGNEKDQHPDETGLAESKQSVTTPTGSQTSDKSKHIETKPNPRKPIIRTVTSKNGTTTYKAVKFADQKQLAPVHINISIKKNVSKINTTKQTKVKTVKDKAGRYRKRRRRQVSSPTTSVGIMKPSPPTEVAKWVPSCINEHTKPYYEAWVDTTLAAITREGINDEVFQEKQRIIQNFQRALEERPDSPELVHVNCLDERYTGRITVRHR